MISGLDNNDVKLLTGFKTISIHDAQASSQSDQRNNLPSQQDHLLLLNGPDVFWCNVDGAVDGSQRNRLRFRLDLNQQRLDNRQRQRQTDPHPGSLSGR